MVLVLIAFAVCATSSKRITIPNLPGDIQKRFDILQDSIEKEEAENPRNKVQESAKHMNMDLIPNAFKYIVSRYHDNPKLINKVLREKANHK